MTNLKTRISSLQTFSLLQIFKSQLHKKIKKIHFLQVHLQERIVTETVAAALLTGCCEPEGTLLGPTDE